ncbi:hypothetical protein DPMN_151124 [Dreissena polymorpha]|uniref:Uncharacterized protein n=1 Tax=Dreissena polymorpha TaxID=45954 RepID=A0A9D4J701_DREPO|nr:hypothetical protein DPMN_151124 [Dreissena polymorpha]
MVLCCLVKTEYPGEIPRVRHGDLQPNSHDTWNGCLTVVAQVRSATTALTGQPNEWNHRESTCCNTNFCRSGANRVWSVTLPCISVSLSCRSRMVRVGYVLVRVIRRYPYIGRVVPC